MNFLRQGFRKILFDIHTCIQTDTKEIHTVVKIMTRRVAAVRLIISFVGYFLPCRPWKGL